MCSLPAGECTAKSSRGTDRGEEGASRSKTCHQKTLREIFNFDCRTKTGHGRNWWVSKRWSSRFRGGENGSTVALLSWEIQPGVLACFTALPITSNCSGQAVFQSVSLYSRVKDLLHSIPAFYHDSPAHRSALVTAFKGLHLQPAMPSQVRGRRWLQGLQAALQNFLKGYPAIVQQLQSVSNFEIWYYFRFSELKKYFY